MTQLKMQRYYYYHRFPAGEIGFLWQKEGLLALDISQLKMELTDDLHRFLREVSQTESQETDHSLAIAWQRIAVAISDPLELLMPTDLNESAESSSEERLSEQSLNERNYQLITQAIAELSAYFAGTLQQFTIPLFPLGTPFQRQVWEALGRILYGEVINYQQLALLIDHPRATRAVGSANGKNPLPIIIPCHRVIASDGSLGGYSGGLITKIALLEQEGFTITAEKKRLRVVPRESVLFQE
ncbi:methylated-DNA--[protein]-cysteine S-methyltransferase [Ignatzschineria sp. F8392]|uniref:methylated-DNA--[protein]-cysteine S-methyltransferase n=1 Tax=Ignatzschineria sp. F8392 TaxID=1980117 RepID=UPI001E417685|nr:methylated-DNA--[protein]-cysteine S-methyltransferase [Ignatzschineria sp. F8392]